MDMFHKIKFFHFSFIFFENLKEINKVEKLFKKVILWVEIKSGKKKRKVKRRKVKEFKEKEFKEKEFKEKEFNFVEYIHLVVDDSSLFCTIFQK